MSDLLIAGRISGAHDQCNQSVKYMRYLMLVPGVVYFLVFHYFPIYEARLAFDDFRFIGPNIWVGMKHYFTLFDSPVFMQVLANTKKIVKLADGIQLPLNTVLNIEAGGLVTYGIGLQHITIGESVHLTLDPAKVLLFNSDSGRRLN